MEYSSINSTPYAIQIENQSNIDKLTTSTECSIENRHIDKCVKRTTLGPVQKKES